MTGRKVFRIFLVKPSHYDEDGYVIQWARSTIPSNSLASVYGLTERCAEERVLGDDVEIEVTPYDETNFVIPVEKIIREIKAADGGFVGLVGVQTNQFPRAIDLARQFLAADITVVAGGFHISGCIAMLPKLPPDIQEAQNMGVILYSGEADGRMDVLLQDVYRGETKPLYNYISDLPDMGDAAPPFLPEEVNRRVAGCYTSFDAGRGCPFECSFCTIINVQGRKSRYRSADEIESIVRINVAQGMTRFFITDDNFARNKNWEAILDRLIYLREEEGLRFKFIMQIDTMAHRTPRFIEKSARAGCNRVYIGLENLNPDNLLEVKKRQNKIWEYRKMLQLWKEHGIIIYVGYILGFPSDTPESIRRDIELLKRELPVDLVEFLILTPLPGSADHQRMHAAGTWMDPDMNKYDLEHVTARHPTMSAEELEAVYREAWDQYYTPEHVETVLKRGAVHGVPLKKLMYGLGGFYASLAIEGVHPMQAGGWRRKVRTQRRSGMPIESPLIFYPRRLWEIFDSYVIRLLRLYVTYDRIRKRIEADPNAGQYMDASIAPVTEEEAEEDDLIKTFEDVLPETHDASRPTAA